MGMPLKWTNEAIREDAKKYTTRTEWFKNNSRAYKYARKRKIIDQCCVHMTLGHEIWTNEKIKKCAKKYKFRSDWWKNDKNSYDAALRHNIFEECTEHMEYKINPYVDDIGIIYAYFFNDDSVYIGLTIDPKRRYKNHLLRGPLSEKIKSGISFEYKILEEHISIKDLPHREIYYINKYKQKGQNLINTKSGGSLGSLGNRISLNDIKNSALRYKFRNDWKKSEIKYYSAAIRRKIINDVCNHMSFKHKRREIA